MVSSSSPILYLLGAGPGDPELITLKAFHILEKAKVILYDNLANKELLEFSPSHSEKIYVGKKPYGVYTPQEEILKLIEEKAFQYGEVIRLKGGDPFIFGRGFEEILFAREKGIQTVFVPGITSMQAFGLLDIPLTHRNLCESIWAITGTKKDGSLSSDLRLAMQSNATVVIYMGMKKLEEIAQTYIDSGKGEMPTAIVQHLSLAHQKGVKGKVKNLPSLAKENNLTHPALILIGNTIELSYHS